MVKAKAGMRLDAEGFALMQCFGDRGMQCIALYHSLAILPLLCSFHHTYIHIRLSHRMTERICTRLKYK